MTESGTTYHILVGRARACAGSTSGPGFTSEPAVRTPVQAVRPSQTTSQPAVRVHVRAGMFRQEQKAASRASVAVGVAGAAGERRRGKVCGGAGRDRLNRCAGTVLLAGAARGDDSVRDMSGQSV